MGVSCSVADCTSIIRKSEIVLVSIIAQCSIGYAERILMIDIFVDQYQILIRLFQTVFFCAEIVVPIWQHWMAALIAF